MPVPTIPRSISFPNISQETHRSPSAHSSPSKKSQLTEASLQDSNQRNVAKQYSSCSPYYKGLTICSLAINRGKVLSSNPATETYAAGSTGSSGSRSGFVGKMQEWGTSCFKSKEHRSSSRTSKNRNPFNKKIAVLSLTSRTRATKVDAPIRRTSADSEVTEGKSDAASSSLASSMTKAITRPEATIRKTGAGSEITEGKPDAASSASSRAKEIASVTSPEASIGKTDADLGSTEDKPTASSFASSRTEADVSIARPEATVKKKGADLEVKEVISCSKQHDNTAAPLKNEKPLGEKKPETVSLLSPAPTNPQTSLSPQLSTSTSNFTPLQQAKTHAEKVTSKEIRMRANERKFIWADKYRPSYLKDFLCNRCKALELQDMARNRECSHYIFEGSPGVGKRTMIWALLREIFGHANLQAREECKEFYLKGEAVGSINVNVRVSAKHVEVNLSELRGYEKHVIVQLINEKTNTDLPCTYENCKAIILHGADKLSSDAMVYIRWLLERYQGCNKVFFCCSDASKLQPVKPICKVIQLLRPSIQEIVDVLEFIAKQEGIKLPQQLAMTIANNSKNNLRQAIRSFEATWHFNSTLKEDQEILTGWEDVIANVAANIIEEQSPRQLYIIRGKLQNLIEHNVSPEFIFTMLVEEIKKKVDEELQQHIDKLHRKYNTSGEEHGKRDNNSVRETIQQFMKIEEFIAKFMSWYKSMILQRELKRREGESLDLKFHFNIT